MGYQRITSIVGLIQIHVASLESSWLSMLHNRVSLLKWHLFILSIQLLRVIGPCTSDGIIFNGTVLPIDITTTCHLWLSPGALNFFFLFSFLFFFFLLVEMFGSDRWNGRGHLYFGADIVLVKHHVKWLSNHTVSTYFPDGYTNPIRLFQSRFVHHNLLGGGGISILTVGRPPPPVNVQETDNSLCPWSFVMTLANPTMQVSPWNIVNF